MSGARGRGEKEKDAAEAANHRRRYMSVLHAKALHCVVFSKRSVCVVCLWLSVISEHLDKYRGNFTSTDVAVVFV